MTAMLVPKQVFVFVNPTWIVALNAANETGDREAFGIAAWFRQERIQCLSNQGFFGYASRPCRFLEPFFKVRWKLQGHVFSLALLVLSRVGKTNPRPAATDLEHVCLSSNA